MLLGYPQDGGPEGLLQALPLRAVLEVVFAGLDLILAPPALGVWPSRCPLEVLVHEAVPRLEMGRTSMSRWEGGLARPAVASVTSMTKEDLHPIIKSSTLRT